MGNRWIIALPRSYNTPYEKIGDETAELEVPFDIPDSWEWVRLGNIVNIVSARRVHQSDWRAEGVPFYRAREIVKLSDSGYVNNELFISQKLFDEYAVSGVPQPGDLMVTAVGTLGKTYIVQPGDRFYYKDASVICFENYGKVCAEYIKVLMATPYMMNQINDNASGTTVGTITIVRANNYLIPLPPLSEQERIVKFLSTLEPLLSSYNDKYTQLDALHTTFPSELKKSILQWAVQGRLVPQDPSDEPAAALLERIRGEKERLVREGKIKKDKHESVIFRRDNSHYEKLGKFECIIEDELPFEIPCSWCWVRLSNIVYNHGQKTPDRLFSYIDIGSIDNKNQQLNLSETWVEPEKAASRARKIVKMGDILYSSVRPYLHNMCIINRNFDKEPIASTGFAVMACHQGIFNKFLFYYLLSPWFDAYANHTDNAKGVAYPAINDDRLYKALVPIPPLAEQHRVVEKIEELMALVKTL